MTALLLTWVALWSPGRRGIWIDDALVFIPGTIAIGCAVLLTFESVWARAQRIAEIGTEKHASHQDQEELAQHTSHKAQ